MHGDSGVRSQGSGIRGQESGIRGQESGESASGVSRNPLGSRIMEPSILPTSRHRSVSSECSCIDMKQQSRAKSRAVSVSLFSPSQSVSLLTKWFGYRRLAHASRRFKHTEREDRRAWLVKEY